MSFFVGKGHSDHVRDVSEEQMRELFPGYAYRFRETGYRRMVSDAMTAYGNYWLALDEDESSDGWW